MTKLSELKTICAERDAALSDEERAERHKKTLRDLARQHEVFSPINALEPALAPMRAMEEMLRLAENPALRFAKETMDNSAVRFAREIVDSPALRLAREAAGRVPGVALPSLEIAGLSSLNHFTGLPRDLERVSTPPFPDPMQFRSPKAPRDVDQDRRFEKLAAVVVAQTEEIVELRVEVQRVRESAAGDAERERQAVALRERKEAWMKWVSVVVAAVLSALATRLLS